MTLLNRIAELVVLAVIWGVVAALAVLFVAKVDNEVVGYLLSGLAVVAAWLLTEGVLDALHLNTSFAPEQA